MSDLIKKTGAEITQARAEKLNALLDSIDDIVVNEHGTLIKFRGNLVTVTEGSNIIQSVNGHLVALANTIHLNPVLKDYSSVQKIEHGVEEIRRKSIEDMERLKRASKDCGCHNHD
jgi:stage III sporulation protein SpoIIIAA